MPVEASLKQALKLRNIRFFIAFRFFFNARFYYPVFAILFLDFGLTIEHFALLNVVWAAAIVVLEVPSGALADVFGRKKLLIAAGWLMVVEMALLSFAPKGNLHLLFIVFIFNRLCSGAAEAAASGADESLAYDTLKAQGLAHHWGAVLARQMRVRSLGGVISLMVGAAMYDPAFVQRLCRWIGWDIVITQDMTLRIPLVLTFIFAVITLVVAYKMEEEAVDPLCNTDSGELCRQNIATAFKLTFKAGHWILQTPFALIILLSGVMFDNVMRIIVTVSSQYYRLIEIPEAAFGLIGAVMAGVGMLVPSLATYLTGKYTPRFNFWVLCVLAFAGLSGVAAFIPWFGIFPMFIVMVVLFTLNFFQSHYLNRITESHQRATVLSFRGLSLNLAYGFSGLLFALLLAGLRPGIMNDHPNWDAVMVENQVFMDAIGWLPRFFSVTLVCLVVFAAVRLRTVQDHRFSG